MRWGGCSEKRWGGCSPRLLLLLFFPALCSLWTQQEQPPHPWPTSDPPPSWSFPSHPEAILPLVRKRSHPSQALLLLLPGWGNGWKIEGVADVILRDPEVMPACCWGLLGLLRNLCKSCEFCWNATAPTSIAGKVLMSFPVCMEVTSMHHHLCTVPHSCRMDLAMYHVTKNYWKLEESSEWPGQILPARIYLVLCQMSFPSIFPRAASYFRGQDTESQSSSLDWRFWGGVWSCCG